MHRESVSSGTTGSVAPTVWQRRLRSVAWLALLVLPVALAAASDDFTKPTAEELAMTSLPGYPGVPAVILTREEITKDDYHDVQHYDRIKILTEEGKKYANVELGFVSSSGFSNFADDKMIESIIGRTIHADGTVIPFTGKPYLKVLEKVGGIKVQEKVFTLPAVEVGSIIEYRYATRYNDSVYESPSWIIQDDLYLKHGHFVWYPTTRSMINARGEEINTISWFPILPQGAKIERHELPGNNPGGGANQMFELDVKDVPPRLKEEFMPPVGSFSYSVRFNYTSYRTPSDYWVGEGKHWSKRVNSFASEGGAVHDATQKAIAGATTPEEKLRGIYNAVMALENTRYTRDHDRREDKAEGMGKVNEAADVLSHERGSPTELTELFLAMARSAGFPAYAMLVPDRSSGLFYEGWLNFQQFDDIIAIVKVNGKEEYFDPGARYCEFGQLAWQHTALNGLRQTDGGTAFGMTPFDSYKDNRTTRVANLTLSEQGEISGKIDLGFQGAPALRWRQAALSGDEESLRKDLRETLEGMVPRSLQVEVSTIGNLQDPTKPLNVSYKVEGGLGNAVGKRMLLPADVFLAGEAATFPHDKRESPVYFHYTQMMQDAIRINFPKELSVEAVPTSARLSLPNTAVYSLEITPAATNVTTRRTFVFGEILMLSKDYPALRSFYSQLESKDQESIVLKSAPAAASTASPAAAPGN